MGNMDLWNKYATPPTEALKGFNNGSFTGTDISPMWRIRCLTEEFGDCGFGWYAEITEHWSEEVGGIQMVFVNIKLYLNRNGEWSKGISATGGNSFVRKVGGKVSDEAYKMAYTDAIGGACKMLGIGGAVYWERGYSKYEDSYVADAAMPVQQYAKPAPAPVAAAEVPLPDDTAEDAQYRVLCLRKFKLAALNASCMRNFGTDFRHTAVADLRTKMPDEFLNELRDLTNE